jgi:uncharacterized Tic20 family protein
MNNQDKDREVRQWSMFLHLSLLTGLIIPFAGLIVPILIWQIKKEELPELDDHGKIVVNWIISEVIYLFVCFVLSFVIIGIFLIPIIGGISIVFPIIGGIQANKGILWKYPLSLNILK